jgi:hypothetical protein
MIYTAVSNVIPKTRRTYFKLVTYMAACKSTVIGVLLEHIISFFNRLQQQNHYINRDVSEQQRS